ncbi:sensor domain-containing protein [Catellatospora sp. NPDC049609]|uniref:sensor histidine kinase n=1 Tax=Catellatospora sp. NPDC049609 TaxID=3155505 RepID=UPI00343ADA6D
MTILQRLGRDAAYNLLGLPLAIASFSLGVTLFAAGVGTLVTFFIGIALLAAAVLTARGFADIERLRQQHLYGRPVPRPHYRRAAQGAGWIRRLLAPLRQGQSWLDLLWAVLNLPIAIIAFVFTVTWWAAALGGLTYWYWGRFLPEEDGQNVVVEVLFGADTAANRLTFHVLIGAFALVTLYGVQRGAAALQSGFASMMLTRLAQLQGRIDDLSQGRAAAVSAEAVALRKLERDIHDGPQQRLIRLAMELSRARRQLADDPSAAASTIDGALGQAKETLDELRALSRGIAPPILADRGLAAALTSLAERSTVPVELDVAVEGRLPAATENALYFAAAEALSNIAKHSGAACARIELTEQDGRVYLMVTDDGAGGAHLAKGHGLAGLADRLRAVDGEFAVDSPAGGPTILVAQAPATVPVA